MDPITLFSILIKMTSFDFNKNKDINDKINNKSRTELIQLYQSTMNQKSSNFFKSIK